MDEISRPPPRGDWLLTHTGKQFYPLDPRPEAVCLVDIAHALSQLCRWTGHVAYHYSVAQHAVQVALAVEHVAPDYALLALHHDDAEAYLGDIARPWKRNLLVMRDETNATVEDEEEVVRAVILQALGIQAPAEAWDVIRVADNRVLQAEAETLMPKHVEFPTFGRAPPGCVLYQMLPEQARDAFLMQHNRLSALAQLA
jgi:hypothetical protein